MKSARRVARPSRTGRTPWANGSRVPAWPTRFCPARRRTFATTSWEVQPLGLLTFRMPVRSPTLTRGSGAVAMLAFLFDGAHETHDPVAALQRAIKDELEVGRVAQVQAFLQVV